MKVPVCPAVCPLCGPDFPKQAIAHGRDFEYATTDDQEFSFVRCMNCNCVLLDPRPVDDVIGSLYPAHYEPYRFAQLPLLVRKGRDFVQRAKVSAVKRYAPAGARIVDVGCGAGALLRLLREHGDPSWQLCGWDYPGAHLERLTRDGFDIIAGPIDAEHAPTNVDLFVLNQVIEHFAHPDRILSLLARSLRNGGHIVLETPNIDGLDARWFRARHWGGYHIPRHMVLFDTRSLGALVQRHGFALVETKNLASPAFWVQSLHHAAVESKLAPLAGLCNLRNLPLVAAFSLCDLARSPFAATSNQRLVARKLA